MASHPPMSDYSSPVGGRNDGSYGSLDDDKNSESFEYGDDRFESDRQSTSRGVGSSRVAGGANAAYSDGDVVSSFAKESWEKVVQTTADGERLSRSISDMLHGSNNGSAVKNRPCATKGENGAKINANNSSSTTVNNAVCSSGNSVPPRSHTAEPKRSNVETRQTFLTDSENDRNRDDRGTNFGIEPDRDRPTSEPPSQRGRGWSLDGNITSYKSSNQKEDDWPFAGKKSPFREPKQVEGEEESHHDAIDPFTETPTPEGFDAGNVVYQPLHGDRCATRGASRGEAIRRKSKGRYSREKSQVRQDKGTATGESSRQQRSGCGSVTVGSASAMGREQQERMIKQLVYDNRVLKRKVAGFQLALQLSADEDGFCSSPSFSTTFSAAPPAFPRNGAPPPQSPRVTRGWKHKKPPARRYTSAERDLSYESIARQLDTGECRSRMLRRINESLGARVSELESGKYVRVTQAKIVERDEEIALVREELAILKRLSRAQDRKFAGSEGYAMARRLWATEEELRVARSTITSLNKEVMRIRQCRNSQGQACHRSISGEAPSADPYVKESARVSPRQAVRRKRTPEKAARSKKSQQEIGRKEDIEGHDQDQQARGSGDVARSANEETGGRSRGTTLLEGEKAKKDIPKAKSDMLQRALTNMRNKAKGELRAARVEIDKLREGNAVLSRALETKSKEVRMQLVQVNCFKRELRGLSAGAAELEEASFLLSSTRSTCKTWGVASASAGAKPVTESAVPPAGRRAQSAAASAAASTASATGLVSADSLAAASRSDLRLGRKGPNPEPLSSRFMPMKWSQSPERGGTAPYIKEDSSFTAADKKNDVWGVKGARDDELTTRAHSPVEFGMGCVLEGGTEPEEGRKDVDAELVPKSEEINETCLPTQNPILQPCRFAGLLDMSEPLALKHQRSFGSMAGSHSPMQRTRGRTASMEQSREGVISTCFFSPNGCVQHAKNCMLRDVPEPGVPEKDHISLYGGNFSLTSGLCQKLASAVPDHRCSTEEKEGQGFSGLNEIGNQRPHIRSTNDGPGESADSLVTSSL